MILKMSTRVRLPGRFNELAALDACWDAASAGTAQLAIVTGEPGMGRTSLLDAFGHGVGKAGSVYAARCLPFDLRNPNGLPISVIRRMIGATDDMAGVEVLSALTDFLKDFRERDAKLGLLSHLLGIQAEQGAHRSLDPAALRQAAFACLGDILLEPVDGRPVALLLDDLQWLDPGSAAWLADLCHRLALASGPQRILVVASAAPETFTPDTGALAVRPLSLQALSLTEMMEVAAGYLGTKLASLDAPARSLVKKVLDRAEGNPCYANETLQALVETGTLRRTWDNWEVSGDGESAILPATIEAAIATRVNALQDQIRDRLHVAAAAGPRLQGKVLGALFQTQLASGLQEAHRMLALAEKSAGTEPAHEGRHELHRRVGEVLESVLGDDIPTFAGDLAHHFSEAGDASKACRYLVIAGDRARQAHLLAEAASSYRQALAWAAKVPLADDGPDLAKVRMNLAQVDVELGETAEAELLLVELEAAEGGLSGVWRARGRASELKGDFQGAFVAYTKALSHVGDDATEHALCKAALADINRRLGRFTEGIAVAEEALEILESLDMPSDTAKLHGVIGVCQMRCDKPEAALVAHSQALTIRERIGDVDGIARTYNNLGILEASIGRFGEAEADYRRALDGFRKLGNVQGTYLILNNLGDLYLKKKDGKHAEKYLIEAKNLARQLGDETEFVTTTGNLAETFLLRDMPAEALRLIEACFKTAHRLGQTEFMPDLFEMKGRALEMAGKPHEALVAYDEAGKAARMGGNLAFAERMREAFARIGGAEPAKADA
jgi:tetratricopeptide (TPR) repeat protein